MLLRDTRKRLLQPAKLGSIFWRRQARPSKVLGGLKIVVLLVVAVVLVGVVAVVLGMAST